jgi:hypothetical protein
MTIDRLSVPRGQPYLHRQLNVLQEEPAMNGRKLTREVARISILGVVSVLAACAHAPAAPEEMSILDALENQRMSLGPASCAALNATAVCEKSTRLDPGRSCRCVDPRAFSSGARALRL